MPQTQLFKDVEALAERTTPLMPNEITQSIQLLAKAVIQIHRERDQESIDASMRATQKRV